MRTNIIEIVSDSQLKKKEKEVTEIVKGFYPSCGSVKLYRTADGRIGFQIPVTLTPQNRKQIDKVYRAVMKYLGENRGRPSGVETIQTKLRLPKPIYAALKKTAADSRETMSQVVTESLAAQFRKKSTA
jgi:hypothetical protein